MLMKNFAPSSEVAPFSNSATAEAELRTMIWLHFFLSVTCKSEQYPHNIICLIPWFMDYAKEKADQNLS